MNEQKNQNKPNLSLIAVVDQNRGIGENNKLLFHLSEDLKHFKRLTEGHTVIMGYNTYKSIGKALPNRRNIVLSTRIRLLHDARVCRTLEDAIKATSDDEKVFVIGGASIYQQTIDMANTLYLTEVDATFPADRFFPDYSDFRALEVTGSGCENGLNYKFVVYSR